MDLTVKSATARHLRKKKKTEKRQKNLWGFRASGVLRQLQKYHLLKEKLTNEASSRPETCSTDEVPPPNADQGVGRQDLSHTAGGNTTGHSYS